MLVGVVTGSAASAPLAVVCESPVASDGVVAADVAIGVVCVAGVEVVIDGAGPGGGGTGRLGINGDEAGAVGGTRAALGAGT